MPKVPSFVNVQAQAERRRTAKLLFDIALLTELDETLLARYRLSYGNRLESNGQLEKYGSVLVVKPPKLKPSSC